MSTAPLPTKPAEKNDLPVPFEQQVLPREYQQYYRTKRNNFFASIQKFPELWDYYMMLDQIWFREIDVLKPSDPNKAFPIIVYIKAHAKVRIAIELAFTGCLPEARSIMRDAVEFVAHAHHMLKDPALQVVWLNKLDDGRVSDIAPSAVFLVPGDGIFTAWSYRAGAGRAEAFLLNPQPLTARTAYEWGVVAEVVPNGKALSRARELAEVYLKAPEVTRRNTRVHFMQPLKERIVREVGYGLSLEGASAADLVKSMQAKSEPVAQKGKVA